MRTKNQPSTTLTINQFYRIKALFEEKKWEIEDDNDYSIFSRYCKTFQLLDAEQQDLLLDLSHQFIHIKADSYSKELIVPLQQLRDEHSGKILMFLPCVSEKEYEVKSTHVVLYQLKGTTIKTMIDLDKYSVCTSTPEVRCLPKDGKYELVLVDDFVGTGGTALDAYQHLVREMSEEAVKGHVAVLCIVAMQEGIERLQREGIRTYYRYCQFKGISDAYEGEAKDRALKVMEDIESKINHLKPEFHFGYGRSEALVCMERCPNNTFPIYWVTKKTAPYER